MSLFFKTHMKKNRLIGIITSIYLVLIAADVYDITSAGAPIASTGAPNESTCARSGCHTGSTINSGSGILDIDFNNGLGTYEPGKTYKVTVSLDQENINRFGFQMLALQESDSTNAGVFKILDTTRTQVLEGVNQYLGRKYITYKYPGTIPYAPHLGKWTFEWTAPSTYDGAITFYAAAVSANNDGTDKGDIVYTKELTMSSTPSGVNEEMDMNAVSVFPNPSNGRFEIKNETAEITAIDVYNIKGEKVYEQVISQQRLGNSVNSPDNLSLIPVTLFGQPDGVYFLRLHSGSKKLCKKIIIER